MKLKATRHLLKGETRESKEVTQSFNVGTVVTQGQILHHTFTLSNLTNSPVRILKAITATPCCSSIGTLPEVIPPRGVANIPVTMRLGEQTEDRTVVFHIKTTDNIQSDYIFILIASSVAACEIKPSQENQKAWAIGTEGKQKISLITRSRRGEGVSLPDVIEVTRPLAIANRSQSEPTVMANGVVEATCTIEVVMPASSKIGNHDRQLILKWANGFERRHLLRWKVRPQIEVTPSGVILGAAQGKTRVLVSVESEEQRFRITDVKGAMLGGDEVDPIV